MESNAFYNYLVTIKKQKNQSANTRLRKCETIEANEDNLDQEWEKDQLHRIFHLFDYSKEDMVNDKPQKHHVHIRGGKGSRSIYEGTKDYQSSLGKYIEFKKYVSNNPEELQRLRDMRVVCRQGTPLYQHSREEVCISTPVEAEEESIRRNNETSVFDSSSEYLQDKTKENFLQFLELRPNEQNKEYVIRVFEKLDDMNCISEYELKRLRANDADSVDYRRRTFGFRRPFYVESLSERREKSTGQDRYYAVPASGKYYLCAQWYFKESHTSYNLDKFQKWALRMFSGACKESI